MLLFPTPLNHGTVLATHLSNMVAESEMVVEDGVPMISCFIVAIKVTIWAPAE